MYNIIIFLPQVNKNCTLTIPDHFYTSSNCSNDQIYVHEMRISNITADSFILLSHPLLPNKRNCAFHINDSSGKTHINYTNHSE